MNLDFLPPVQTEESPGGVDPSLQKDIQNIPNKLSFKISEAAGLLGVKPHVLRYWELEFRLLHPRKMPNGQRLYFRKDIETALLIKKLLYRDGFSVKGAQKVLRSLKKENRRCHQQSVQNDRLLKTLNTIQESVCDLRNLIE